MHKSTFRVAVAIFSLVILLSACAPSQTATEAGSIRTGQVETGSIDQVVSATGSVFPEERVNLNFQQSGVVTEAMVDVGSVVNAGDPLAKVNGAFLDLAVQQAELALRVEELNFERLFAPPSKNQVAGAQAAVAAAVASYNKVADGVDEGDLAVAQLQYEQAYSQYVKAKLDFDANNKAGIPILGARSDQYAAALGVAVANLESARLRLVRLRAPPDKNSLAAASAGIAQAQADLNKVKSGPGEITVLSAQAQIDRAKLGLSRAIQRRDDTIIRAPFTGVVSVVNVKVGTLPPAGQPALVMIDSSHLHVEVNVDELDIGRIGVGQPVRVVFDALPGEVVLGQVTSIASVATINAGVVSYTTRIDLEQNDLPIRSGMTATADIIVQRVEGILVVPNWAVRFDRESGQAFASVPAQNNQLQEVPVLLGIRGETHSQVLAGLQAGDPVVVKLQPGELSFEPGGNGDQ